jgi:hypothetical protein
MVSKVSCIYHYSFFLSAANFNLWYRLLHNYYELHKMMPKQLLEIDSLFPDW